MGELRGVIFDVDGTLADTERDGHRVAFNAAFREFGLDWNWTPERYRELVKVAGGKERLRHWIEREAPECAVGRDVDRWVAEIHAVKRRHFAVMLEQGTIPLRPGVQRLLAELRSAGVKLGIATTMSETSLRELLRALLGADAPGWFDGIGAGDMVQAKKPAPDVYRLALERLDLSPRDCLAIEDSEIGLQAALAAGLPALVAVSPYSEGGEFPGAMAVVSDLGEPGAPMRMIRGGARGAPCVDLALLRQWHRAQISY